MAIECQDGACLHVPLVEKMNVLGSSLLPDGSSMACVEEQLLKATRRFWELAGIFVCKSVPISTKFSEYVKRIVPVALNNCGAWVWCSGSLAKLGAWEGLTLRRAYGLRRRSGETWLAWHKRSIRVTRSLFARCGHEPLAARALARIFGVGRSIATPSSEYTSVMLGEIVGYKDTQWWKGLQAAGDMLDPGNRQKWRRAAMGRPALSWERPFCAVWGNNWREGLWLDPRPLRELKAAFIRGSYGLVGVEVPRVLRKKWAREAKPPKPPPKKQPRVVCEPHLRWDAGTHLRVEIVSDNETVVRWMNGERAVHSYHACTLFAQFWAALYSLWHVCRIRCRSKSCSYFRHAHRELNKRADALAGDAVLRGYVTYLVRPLPRAACRVQIHFDGSCPKAGAGGRGPTGIGWWARWSATVDCRGRPVWTPFCAVGRPVGYGSSLGSEVCAAMESLRAVLSIVATGQIVLQPCGPVSADPLCGLVEQVLAAF